MTTERWQIPPESDDKERRIAKLARINAALMQRVERSMDQQANAYSLFQTAISLESQVRVRTEELKNTLFRLEHANSELRAARDAAEQANLVKTRFFTSVGHDLLQPLHAARLSLSAMAEFEETSQGSRLAGQVDHALSTIEDLLRTILDLSKLEAGVIKPAIQEVPLRDLFASLSLDLEPLARQKGVEFSTRPTEAMVLSDPLMLRRILQNLTANAVHYTETGKILLAARRRGTMVRIEVWDTGTGIPSADCQRIFEEFQRGSSTGGHNGNGFGLGLSIMRRMAETLNHAVGLCSKLDRGTCFSVSAPYAGISAERPAAPAPVATPPQAYGFDSAKVMVIDNEPSVLDAMHALLQRWSCDVRVALRLDRMRNIAVTGADAFRPDLIVADYHLDNGDCGLDAVRQLRARWDENLPAIVVTADHSPDIAEAVHNARCELLCKPLKPAELRVLMLHLLRA
ncbi:MAG: hybrid sensor histidine kinase/response regulator [Hyphomicrobiaceae bacterium]|nr:hybrid sensor histidine kinase/response regulator [Hyphomicrobiaceae bacterium]